MLQGTIQRMAESSRACKLWCSTAVSAILFLTARTEVAWYTLVALIPLVMFLVLDVYYLNLERGFITLYNSLVAKLRDGTFGTDDIFEIRPIIDVPVSLIQCLRSPSVFGFYPLGLGIILAVFWIQCALSE